MEKAGTVKIEVHPISLKSIIPVVPKNGKEKELLVEDLTQMVCKGLLLQPWALKSEAMAQEFLQERSNEWKGTMYRDPEQWMADSQAEVYNFWKEGKGMAGRTNKLTDTKFRTSINPKDGHAIADCVDPREKRVLEFVMLILYPKKPSHVILTMGNTIFGALSRDRKVNWGQVFQDIVGKLVSMLEKGKAFPISSYLFYLYHRFECLREEEMQELEVAKQCLEYGVSLEVEAQPDVVEIDPERKSLSSAEQWKILATSLGSRRKQTYQVLEGWKPVRLPNQKVVTMTSFNFEDDPFQQIWEEMDQLQVQYSKLEFVTKEASKFLGDCKLGNIIKKLKKLKQKDMVLLEANNMTLRL